jgi:gluconate 2-dehydrogenase gamma chain
MNTSTGMEMLDPNLMTRREAIRRTALALGVAITPSLLIGVMNAQTVSRSSVDAPTYLSSPQFGTVRAIAERIIPKTDTPGAIDVGVPAFIDLMYGKYLTEEEKRVFAAGLAEVEKISAEQGQRNFAQLSSVQQDALLTQVARAAQEKEKTFFHLMKELSLLGYFTSEPVGKKVLHYDPIPGRYQGCIPLSEVGNVSWTR